MKPKIPQKDAVKKLRKLFQERKQRVIEETQFEPAYIVTYNTPLGDMPDRIFIDLARAEKFVAFVSRSITVDIDRPFIVKRNLYY